MKLLTILMISFLLSIVMVEGYLQIFNPFGLVVKNRTIQLDLLENTQSNFRIIKNQTYEKLDPYVLIRRNSMGFRGPQPPSDYDNHLKIFAVGGSTTACIALSDGTTWPDHLFTKLSKYNPLIWGTNAGFDGHSTWGHVALLEQHIVHKKPDVVLLLIGINEPNHFYIERMKNLNRSLWDPLYSKQSSKQLPQVESPKVTQKEYSTIQSVELGYSYDLLNSINLEKWSEYSNIAATLLNFRKQKVAEVLGLTHRVVDFNKLPEKVLAKKLKAETFKLGESEPHYETHPVRPFDKNLFQLELNLINKFVIPEFEKNLARLLELSIENNFKLVLITQPAIYGRGVDPDSGADLENMVLSQGNGEWGMGLNGREKWQLLEAINNVTRDFARQHSLAIIDLADLLPKRSEYFYDYIHYSKAGSLAVANIVEKPICQFLAKEFSEKIMLDCDTNNSN